jgi:hypothetical protein
MSVGAGSGLHAVSGARIDGFDKPRLPDRDVNQTGRGVEERHVRRAGDRPDVGDLAGAAIDFDQRAVVAGRVKPAGCMVDVETMRASRRQPPLSDRVQNLAGS